MPIIAKEDSGPRELPPTGLCQAVCAFVEDVGLSFSEMYHKTQHKIIICWELAERMSDDRPFMLSKTYTLSLGEKANLRRDLQSWRGKPFTDEELEGFDVEKLRGANCMVNVIHEAKGGKTRAKIDSIAPLMKGMEKIAPQNTDPPAWIDEQRKVNAASLPKGDDEPDPAFADPPPSHDESGIPF